MDLELVCPVLETNPLVAVLKEDRNPSIPIQEKETVNYYASVIIEKFWSIFEVTPFQSKKYTNCMMWKEMKFSMFLLYFCVLIEEKSNSWSLSFLC